VPAASVHFRRSLVPAARGYKWQSFLCLCVIFETPGTWRQLRKPADTLDGGPGIAGLFTCTKSAFETPLRG
jgi:hypothetical protein